MSLLAGSAVAGPNDTAIREVVDRAVAQWSVFLTCSVLEPPLHTQIRRWWDDERADLNEVLARADLAPDVAAAIAAAVAPEQMMTMTLGDAATLIAFCNADPSWYRNVTTGRDVIRPSQAVQRLLTP